MQTASSREITRLFVAWGDGEESALVGLSIVYDEL